jgi:hypothetical protein
VICCGDIGFDAFLKKLNISLSAIGAKVGHLLKPVAVQALQWFPGLGLGRSNGIGLTSNFIPIYISIIFMRMAFYLHI